jgi:predicted nucleic acid-binding protein
MSRAVAIVDTTVIIHIFRGYAPAINWFTSFPNPLGVTTISYLEIIYGAGSKLKQASCKALLSQFDLVHLTSIDQNWAIKQMETYRLSHGLATNDCLIASVAHSLQIPLYTHNLKDMTPIIGTLAIKPYT